MPLCAPLSGAHDGLSIIPADQVRVLGISSNAGNPLLTSCAWPSSAGCASHFRDESGQVAESVGAHTTPTAVVIDGSGKIRFRGWIDNDACLAIPTGNPGSTTPWSAFSNTRRFRPQVPIFGCAITRSLFARRLYLL